MQAQSRRLGYVEGWASVILNSALFVVKYWAGTRFGSIAMITAAPTPARNFHHLPVHSYGEHREYTFHLDFPPLMPQQEAHEQASLVEKAIRRQIGAEATAHVEPGAALRASGGSGAQRALREPGTASRREPRR
jgi:divalent metal cation (Fe/Co/Zn/Cd) transporter